MIPSLAVYEDVSDSNNLSRSLLEHGPAIALVDENGVIIYKNTAANQLFGEELDNGLGTNALEQIHPDDRQHANEQMAYLLRNPNAQSVSEVRYRLKDGSYRWLGATGVNLFDDPDVNAIAVYYRDISMRKQTEQQLLLLESALHAAANGVVITDSDGNIEWVNPSFSRLTGYAGEDVIGRNPRFLQSGVQEDSFYREMWDTILSGETWSGQLVNKRADGTLYTEEMTVTPVRDGNNRIEHFIAIKQDVSHREQAEKAVRDSENRYRSLFENSANSLWEADLSKMKVYIDSLQKHSAAELREYLNEHPETMFKCAELMEIVDVNHTTLKLVEADSKDDVLLARIFTPNTLEGIKEWIISVFEGENYFETESQLRTMTGKQLWASMQIALVAGYEDTWAQVSVAATDITGRKLAEQALRDSENRYRSLFENSANSLWEEDLSKVKTHLDSLREDGVSDISAYLDANPEALIECMKMVEMVDINNTTVELLEAGSKEELLAGLAYAYTPETLEVFRQLLLGFAKGETHVECETMQQTMKGKQLWLSLRMALVTGYEDTWEKVSIAVTDITERRRAELETKARNRELTFLNHIIALSSSALNVNEVLTNICGEVKRHMGFNHVAAYLLDEERVKATALAEAKSPECPSVLGSTISAQTTEIIDQMANANSPLVMHSALTSLDPGTHQDEDAVEKDSVVVCLPLRIRDEVQGIVCCLGGEVSPSEQDLDLLASVVQSTAKAVENGLLYGQLATYNKGLMSTVDEQTRMLRHSNHQLEAILNNTHDSILLFDKHMMIQTANLAFSKQFGYSPDAAVGLPMTALAAPESIEALSFVMETMWDGSENHSLEMLGQRQDGSTFDAEVVFITIPDNDYHVVCTIHDISHLKSVERMKDRFIASVNHELRNPIAGIILSANGLHTHFDRLSDESKLKQIDHIRTQSRILSELTDAILNIARVESRTNNPDREIVDMYAIVDNVITEWRPQIADKHQHIDLACEPIPMLVAGDFTDYARVWRNLISNAVKYTPNEGSISIRLGVVDKNDNGIVESSSVISLDSLPESMPQDECPYVVGQIEDTGHGMSQEDLDNLFTRFYRGWAHYNSIPGTGLGLSLVREVLNLYGGDIAVESTLGTGSVFTFWLPLKEDSES